MEAKLEAPFPYFGGKSRVAAEVWRRFGDTPNYVEPFCGSCAVLLSRPASHKGHIETVNDADGLLSNFWRAIKADPGQTAYWADNPVIEVDLHARHSWLVGQRDSLVPRLEGDPDYYDAKIAGWWVWGMCCWIGGGFCSGQGAWHVDPDTRQLVRADRAEPGVNRQLPHLGDAGKGLQRRRPHLGSAGMSVNRNGIDILQWFEALAERLRYVRVCSGDWSRVCGPTPTYKQGLTAVFLDPPYDQTIRVANLYRIEDPVSAAAREWAIANGSNPLMRIALCGYEGEHEMPPDWQVYEWKAAGGYSRLGGDDSPGTDNGAKERIWFSPHTLKVITQGVLI